jgi:hypothetical protein
MFTREFVGSLAIFIADKEALADGSGDERLPQQLEVSAIMAIAE